MLLSLRRVVLPWAAKPELLGSVAILKLIHSSPLTLMASARLGAL